MRIADPYRLRARRFDYVFVASLQDGEFPRRDAVEPTRSSPSAQRRGARPAAAARHRGRGALPVPRLPAAAAPPALPLLPRQRRERRRRGALAAARRGPQPGRCRARTRRGEPCPRPRPRPRPCTGSASPLGDRAGARDRRPGRRRRSGGRWPAVAAAREGRRAGRRAARRPPAAAEAGDPRPGPAHQAGGDRGAGARSPPTAARPWRGSTSAPTAGSSPTSSTRSRSTRCPTRCSRAASSTTFSSASTASGPEGDALPRPGSLARWLEPQPRAGRRASPRTRDGRRTRRERAMVRRVEGLLARFLAEEARRETGGFEPWLLEARFADDEEGERPALEIDGWRLHGAIDRVDRAPDGRALVLDYKLSGPVHPAREARGGRKAAAAALPDRRRRALGGGGGRRPVPPAARHPAAPPARGGRSRRRPRSSPPTGSPEPTGRRRRFEAAARGRPRARGRDRRADAGRRHPPRPGAARRPARPRHLPAVLRIRADLPPRPGAGRADRRGRGGGVSAAAPQPERRASSGPAIERRAAATVLVEAGAGTGKTGVMVDRYCRLVCDEGVSPDAVLAFTFTDKAAAELRAADPGRARAAGRGRLRARPRAARRARQRLGDDDPRLLQPAARGPPGGGRDRPAVPRARRARGRARRARGLRRGARGVPRRRASDERERRSRPSASAACARWSPAPTPSCAAAARPSRRLPEPPPPDVAARAASAPRRRPPARVEELKPGSANRELVERALGAPRRPAGGAVPGLDDLAALRTDQHGEADGRVPRGDRRGAGARSPRPARAARAYRHLGELLRAFRGAASRPPRRGARGSTSRTCRSSPRGCWSGPRSATAYRARFSHLMVDEFQDTNRLQLRLIEALRGPAHAS